MNTPNRDGRACLLYLSTLRYPGQTFAVARHDQIVNPPSTSTAAPVR